MRLGKRVMLAAGDTFRAAASEQLETWADRAGVPLVKAGEGADPAAVIFDAVKSATARGYDMVIADTAAASMPVTPTTTPGTSWAALPSSPRSWQRSALSLPLPCT